MYGAGDRKQLGQLEAGTELKDLVVVQAHSTFVHKRGGGPEGMEAKGGIVYSKIVEVSKGRRVLLDKQTYAGVEDIEAFGEKLALIAARQGAYKAKQLYFVAVPGARDPGNRSRWGNGPAASCAGRGCRQSRATASPPPDSGSPARRQREPIHGGPKRLRADGAGRQRPQPLQADGGIPFRKAVFGAGINHPIDGRQDQIGAQRSPGPRRSRHWRSISARRPSSSLNPHRAATAPKRRVRTLGGRSCCWRAAIRSSSLPR